MNSEPHRVIEYWRRNASRFVEGERIAGLAPFAQVRDPSLEIAIRTDGAE